MPQNLEIKAALHSLSHAEEQARKLGARFAGTLRQTDTYFAIGSDRLKLREINGKRAEMIMYTRPNLRKSRYSDYRVVPVRDAGKTKALFTALFGVQTVVRKKRKLYLYKNARIHLDSVAGLGTFLEFEVIVRQGKKQAQHLMSFLRKEFEISPNTIIGGSYSDM